MKNPQLLIKKINAIYPWYKPIEVQKDYWEISNHPVNGIIIQYKPNAAGIFILNLTYFEFYDNILLCDYFKQTLKHPKAIFYVTRNNIYINPVSKHTDEDLVNLFIYIIDETTILIDKIRKALDHSK